MKHEFSPTQWEPGMESNSVVNTRALGKHVGGPEGRLDILQQVELDILAGEAVAILGTSGSGKSTLLGLLAGLDTPSEGEVNLLAQNLNQLDEDGRARLRAGRVGFVFQSFQLLPGLTALENVMLPSELSGRAEAGKLAREALDRVGLAKRLHHLPNQLSGGEQQRVALARAFAPNPRVLFADEPTGNLDQHTGQRIIDLMFDLKEKQATTLILVTHDPALAEHCDRRYLLDAGYLREASA